jgi:hypothetical protein
LDRFTFASCIFLLLFFLPLLGKERPHRLFILVLHKLVLLSRLFQQLFRRKHARTSTLFRQYLFAHFLYNYIYLI